MTGVEGAQGTRLCPLEVIPGYPLPYSLCPILMGVAVFCLLLCCYRFPAVDVSVVEFHISQYSLRLWKAHKKKHTCVL